MKNLELRDEINIKIRVNNCGTYQRKISFKLIYINVTVIRGQILKHRYNPAKIKWEFIINYIDL